MILQLALLICGLALLSFGAEWLVGGSSRLALKYGISPLIVALTIVAFGTSSPELVVCLTKQLTEADPIVAGGFVFGNVIGSNIFNIALILAVGALIRPIMISRQIILREAPILIVATLMLVWFMLDQQITVLEGGLLFTGLLAFLIFSGVTSVRQMARSREQGPNPEQAEELADAQRASNLWLIALILAGILGLALGSHLLVGSAEKIALMLGVPEALVSLTLVAFGTSVPELATVVAAARRNAGDMITGNVIGSNIFNILAIVGITAMAKPIVYSTQEVTMVEIGYMTALAILLFPFLLTRKTLARWEGAILLASCLLYVGYLSQRLPDKLPIEESEAAHVQSIRPALAEPPMPF